MTRTDLWKALEETQLYISKYYATALTDESICRSLWRDTPRRFGVDFEGALPAYIRRVEKIFEA